MANHYIKIDENNNIIKAFSDAFNSSEETDILYKEHVGRHFPLIIYDEDGKYKYRWEDDRIIENDIIHKWTLPQIKENKINQVKKEAEKLLVITDWKVIRHRDQIEISGLETSLTEEEYAQLLTDRQAIRNTSNVIEAEINALSTVQDVEDYVIDFGS